MSKRSRSKSSRSQSRTAQSRTAQSRTGGARSRSTRVVQVWEDGELLRHIPDLVAVDTTDSLVLVIFQKGQVKRYRAASAIRVDLVHTDDELTLARWAADVLGIALRVKDVVGVAPIAYTPETFAPDGRPPAAQQVRAVARQAEKMGLDLVDEFCVGADGWGSLGDPELPHGGRPLSEIEPVERERIRPRGAAAVQLAGAEAQVAFHEHYQNWWRRADGTGGVLHGVALAEPGCSFGTNAGMEAAMQRYRWGKDTAEVIELVERMLDPHDPDPISPCPCRALLFALAERQGIENLVLLQFGWGPEFAAELWAVVHAEDHGSKSLDRMVAALGGGAFRRPDTDRIDRAIDVLLEVATYVPAADRAPIDGMLSWLYWAYGGNSAAGAYAQRALAAHPGRDIPTLVLGKVQRTELPQWAFRKNAHKPDRYALPA